MASRKEPKRAEPVMAWCIVDQTTGRYLLWTIREDHDSFTRLRHERIARVEIREVVPVRSRAKRRKA